MSRPKDRSVWAYGPNCLSTRTEMSQCRNVLVPKCPDTSMPVPNCNKTLRHLCQSVSGRNCLGSDVSVRPTSTVNCSLSQLKHSHDQGVLRLSDLRIYSDEYKWTVENLQWIKRGIRLWNHSAFYPLWIFLHSAFANNHMQFRSTSALSSVVLTFPNMITHARNITGNKSRRWQTKHLHVNSSLYP